MTAGHADSRQLDRESFPVEGVCLAAMRDVTRTYLKPLGQGPRSGMDQSLEAIADKIEDARLAQVAVPPGDGSSFFGDLIHVPRI
jgi:hypothetical protein